MKYSPIPLRKIILSLMVGTILECLFAFNANAEEMKSIAELREDFLNISFNTCTRGLIEYSKNLGTTIPTHQIKLYCQ